MTALSNATVTTEVQGGATLRAPSGTVDVLAKNGNIADASLSSVAGGLVQVSTGTTTPTASGQTTSRLLGHVRDGTAPGAQTLNVLADGYSTSSSRLMRTAAVW